MLFHVLHIACHGVCVRVSVCTPAPVQCRTQAVLQHVLHLLLVPIHQHVMNWTEGFARYLIHHHQFYDHFQLTSLRSLARSARDSSCTFT